MSYCRFGSGDVYVFLSCTGVLECCACWLNEGHDDGLFPPSETFTTTDDMLAHLTKHREAGHLVPDYTFEGLTEDRDENDAWLASEETIAQRAKVAALASPRTLAPTEEDR